MFFRKPPTIIYGDLRKIKKEELLEYIDNWENHPLGLLIGSLAELERRRNK